MRKLVLMILAALLLTGWISADVDVWQPKFIAEQGFETSYFPFLEIEIRSLELEKEPELEICFDPENVMEPSNLTAIEIEEMLREGLVGLGEDFIQAEKDYGINAAFLASLAAWESGWGKSTFAVERNNLFGFMSYDHNTGATKYFETKGHAIDHVAKYLVKHYLSDDGKYFNGYGVNDINKCYATDPNWGNQITIIANRGISRIKGRD